MIRAAPWEVLGTSAAAGRSARGRSSGCVRTPKPPQRKLQRWRLAHHSTLASRELPLAALRLIGARAPSNPLWGISEARPEMPVEVGQVRIPDIKCNIRDAPIGAHCYKEQESSIQAQFSDI
jgi:hypothetical protein